MRQITQKITKQIINKITSDGKLGNSKASNKVATGNTVAHNNAIQNDHSINSDNNSIENNISTKKDAFIHTNPVHPKNDNCQINKPAKHQLTEQNLMQASNQGTVTQSKITTDTLPRSSVSPMLCFIHIPKTAGTSFRQGAEQYFEHQYCLFDYDTHPITSDLLKPNFDKNLEQFNNHELLLSESFFPKTHVDKAYRLKQIIDASNYGFYGGHIGFGKASVLCSPLQMVTFVRNPVQQVVSHYHHHFNQHGFKDKLTDFIKLPKFQNFQSRYLQGVLPELLGFVGITEYYDDSLQLINQTFAINIEHLKKNINENIQQQANVIDADTLNLIEKHNAQDVKLYDRCVDLFAKRQHMHNLGQVWTYGTVANMNQKQIIGWAFRKNDDNPVQLEILVNDTLVATKFATDNRPNLRGFRITTRDAFVGFHYLFTNHLVKNDILEVRCADTKQSLFRQVF